MCIISFHLLDHPIYKIILIANRDEAYARPTMPIHFWKDAPTVLAGRDLEANGTWLGITTEGKFAALTNYRESTSSKKVAQSRGNIIRSFLTGTQTTEEYLAQLQRERQHYQGFNLLIGTVDELYYYSKQLNQINKLSKGTYSVSNAALNTPWPKVLKAKKALKTYAQGHHFISTSALFEQLHDKEVAPENDLPDTGVGISLEKQLSPIFIQTDHYGTRSSTVLLVTYDNRVEIVERTFQNGVFDYDTHFNFLLNAK